MTAQTNPIGVVAARECNAENRCTSSAVSQRARWRGRRLAAAMLGFAVGPAGLLSISGAPAEANPRGGQVVAGSAAIVQASPTQLDILQSTPRAAINWQSFNIAPSEQTNFRQPAASSVALNRVQAGDPSVIAGRLTANGSIVLINPSGITFSKGAQVNVNSIVATPTDISNANFMAGRMRFDKPSPDPRATVVNNGTITVAQRGLAALVAPGVANSGVVQAKLGRVVLAGAKTYTIDFYGDGLVSFDVGPKVTAAPIGAGGQPLKSLVSNTGRIDAAGGTVLLTADAVGGIVSNVVDVPGQISARSSGTSRGLVTIDSGAGAARVSGTIDVSGTKPGQTGGSARITGASVNLAGTARIDARGSSGGGTVWIGGGPHGRAAALRNAATTAVANGAIIDASATGRGSGGQVAVWSDRATRFAGTIRARGGPLGGNGGWVETSGKSTLSVLPAAQVDAAAPSGTPGTWLLDPANLTVTTETNRNITPPGGPSPMSPTVAPEANDALVSAALISRTLNDGTSVTLTTVGAPGTQAGDITVASGITWTRADSLSLLASGAIGVDARISGPSGTLTLTADDAISQTAPIAVGALHALTLNDAGAAIALTNPANAVPGDVTLSALSAAGTAPAPGTIGFVDSVGFTVAPQPGNGLNGEETGIRTTAGVTLQAGGPLLETGSIIAPDLVALTLSATGGAITLGSAANAIPGNITLSALNAAGTAPAAGAIDFVDSSGFTIAAQPGNGLNGQEIGVNTTAAASLSGSGAIRLGGAVGNSATGAVSLTATGNGLLIDGPIISGSSISLTAGSDVALASGLTAPTVIISAGGAITQTGGAITAALLSASSTGAASFPDANAVGTLAFLVSGAGNSFLFRNDRHDLTIGLDDGTSVGTNGGALTVVTTGTADTGFDLTIPASETVFSTGGTITLMAGGAGGVFSNSGTVDSVASSPAAAGNIVLLADAMSLAAGTLDASTAGASGSVVLGPATAANSVTLGAAGSPGVLGLSAADLTSITAGDLQIGYRGETGAALLTGNISVAAPLTIDTAKIPSLLLVTGGGITEPAPGSISSTVGGPLALGIIAGGPVEMGQANKVGTLAGFVDGSAVNSFLFRDDDAPLMIGAVPRATIGVAFDPVIGVPSSAVMTGATTNPLTGVTTAGGNILLETTTAGSLALADPVDAGTGAVGLTSAGMITQDPAPITASSLGILSADRVSLGAFGGAADLNKVGILAAEVLNPGESFVFRNDAASLTIGTADITDKFGTRLLNPLTGAPLTGPLTGVVTNNANIGLRVTTSGDLTLAANVAAGTAGIGLESAGRVLQTAGAVSGGTLEMSAVGSVSLPGANAVPVLAGQATGAGSSFQFRDDSLGLTVGTTPTLLETGTGTPPSAQMLSVAGLSGVMVAGGNIALETTTAGDLTLSQNVNANGGLAALISAGNAFETGGAIVTASGLIVDAAGNVGFGVAEAGGGAVLGSVNDVGTLAGSAGGMFGFLNGPALTIGTVPAGADVAGQSGITASAGAGGDILVQTADPTALLTLAGNLTAGGRAILDTAGAFAQTGAVSATDPVLAVDTTGAGLPKLLGIITSPTAGAGAVAGLRPAGIASNPLRFGGLSAAHSTVLLFADRGMLTGTMAVAGLGLSGTGSSASLFGSIAGNSGPTAALLGVRDPGPEPTYLFNRCIIAGTSCFVQPTAFLVVPPQPALEISALIPLPDLAATLDFITPEAVQIRQPPNPEAPVINIYDEERLCEETGTLSEPARERCLERLER